MRGTAATGGIIPRFGVLGPLQVLVADCVWGDDPPVSAPVKLQGHVSGIRNALRAEPDTPAHVMLSWRPAGYPLSVGPAELDLLALWRGQVLPDVSLSGYAQLAAEELRQRRIVVLSRRIEVDLALGRHAELVPELETLVAAHPLNEASYGQLPPDTAGFVGRGDELSRIKALLSGGGRAADIPRSVGAAGAGIPDSLEERSGLLRSRMAGRRMLLVLDDACSGAQVRAMLPAEPGCAVLRQFAGADRVTGEQGQAAEIIRYCGQLPLAIRIAGTRLAARPQWKLSWLAATEESAGERLGAVIRVATAFLARTRAAESRLPGGVRGVGWSLPELDPSLDPDDAPVLAPCAWFAMEPDNLGALTAQLCRCGQVRMAADLAASACSYYEVASRFDEPERMNHEVLRAAEATGDDFVRAHALRRTSK